MSNHNAVSCPANAGPSGCRRSPTRKSGNAATPNPARTSSVTELVRAGLGVAALPDFLLGGDLQPLGPVLAGHDTALWLLTRPDCRALRSVVTLFDELGKHLRLPGR